MKQLIDFKGLQMKGDVYPTDIDALIECKDSEYIIVEVKYGKARVPYGQRLAIQRMVDDFTKAGKRAVAFICEHKVRDVDTPVVAAKCKIREEYKGSTHKWITRSDEVTLGGAIRKLGGSRCNICESGKARA